VYLLGSTGTQLSVAPLITTLLEDLLDTARVGGGQLNPRPTRPSAAAPARRGREHRPRLRATASSKPSVL